MMIIGLFVWFLIGIIAYIIAFRKIIIPQGYIGLDDVLISIAFFILGPIGLLMLGVYLSKMGRPIYRFKK